MEEYERLIEIVGELWLSAEIKLFCQSFRAGTQFSLTFTLNACLKDKVGVVSSKKW